MIYYPSEVIGYFTIDPTIPVNTTVPAMDRTAAVRYEERRLFDTAQGHPLVLNRIVPTYVGAYDTGDLAADLELAVSRVRAAGSNVHGMMVRFGQDNGDVEGYWVCPDGSVRTETARLVWDDGSDVPRTERDMSFASVTSIQRTPAPMTIQDDRHRNSITGNVTGSVVQAGNIDGGVHR
jgi:hypothetical protein